jgi:hypothetical protein
LIDRPKAKLSVNNGARTRSRVFSNASEFALLFVVFINLSTDSLVHLLNMCYTPDIMAGPRNNNYKGLHPKGAHDLVNE